MAYAEFSLALNADFQRPLTFYRAKDVVEDLTGVAWSGAIAVNGETVLTLGPQAGPTVSGFYVPAPASGQLFWTVKGGDIDAAVLGSGDSVRGAFDILGTKDGIIKRRLQGAFILERGIAARPA